MPISRLGTAVEATHPVRPNNATAFVPITSFSLFNGWSFLDSGAICVGTEPPDHARSIQIRRSGGTAPPRL